MELTHLTYEENTWAKESGLGGGNCGPVAVSRAFNISLQDSTELCLQYRFRPGKGMPTTAMTKLCKMINPESIHEYIFKFVDRYAIHNTRPTLTRFKSANPTGTFIVHVGNHYIVLKNGCIIDPNWYRIGKKTDKRKVVQYWKVA